MTRAYHGTKVAFVHFVLEGGGSERVSLTTARRLALWGIESHFIGTRTKADEFALPEGIGAKMHLLTAGSSYHDERTRAELKAYIEEQDIKIIFVAYVQGECFRDFRPTNGCKLVYWSHAMPFWEHTYDVEAGAMGARYSIKRWVQWHLLGGRQRTTSQAYRQAILERYRSDVEIFDRYIVLCPEYKDEICEVLKLPREQADKIVSFINTIDLKPSPTLTKDKVIVFVSRISLVQKRFDRMVKIWKRAASRLPEWKLRIYGSGYDQWILERMVRSRGIERLELCGYETDLDKIYREASIVCLTSTFEGWGLVLAEGQNDGVVPMVFDCCAGVRRIVGTDGHAGRLIEPFDIDKYADELVALCQDEQSLKAMQQRCIDKRYDYAPDVNDEAWSRLLGDLLPR